MSGFKDQFRHMWELQRSQQSELGLDPAQLSESDQRKLATELVVQLHEEVTELGRLSGAYKRHLLRPGSAKSALVAEEVVDVLKSVIALAQLHGVRMDEVVSAFESKTKVVASRAAGERFALKETTKLICVDMDDVISDLSGWLLELARIKGESASDHWALLEKHKDEFYTSGRFREMPPVPGAVEGMNRLKQSGYNLVIVTARPQWQYKRLYADTLEWLERWRVPHDHILFNKDKVEAVFQHLHPAWPLYFIEDLPKNAHEIASAGMSVLLFDHPRNQDYKPNLPNIQRVSGWNRILEIVP